MRANFEFIEKLGVDRWCFHDRDIAPDGKTLAVSLLFSLFLYIYNSSLKSKWMGFTRKQIEIWMKSQPLRKISRLDQMIKNNILFLVNKNFISYIHFSMIYREPRSGLCGGLPNSLCTLATCTEPQQGNFYSSLPNSIKDIKFPLYLV